MIEQMFSTRAAPRRAGGRGHRAGRTERAAPGRLRFRTVAILLLIAFPLLVAPNLLKEQGFGRSTSQVAYAERRFSYTVRPGDTLWSIALRVAPGRDPRPLIDQLIEDNHLHGDLQVGQSIDLPAPPR